MLKGLFKSAWKSGSVEKRLGFIADIDISVTANQSILEKLATNDVDASVSHAAMSKITDPQVLFTLSQSHKNSDSCQVAESAFQNLIQSACNFSEAEFKAFVSKNPASSLWIAKHCPIPEVQTALLGDLNELEQANVISDVAYSHTRVMLAEKIHTIEALEIARKNLKGKDKSAEKIIKTKIDSIHAAQKLELENATLAKSIREKMEALARYVAWSDEIKVKFYSLEKHWNTLEFSPLEDEKTLYETAFAKVEADVNHHVAITSSQQNQEKIVSKLEALCTDIASYSLDKLLSESVMLTDKFNDLSQQLSKESETIPFSSDVSERFITARKSIKSANNISKAVQDARALEAGGNSDETKDSSDDQNTNGIGKEIIAKDDVVKDSTAKDEQRMLANRHAKAILTATKNSGWSNRFPILTSKSEAILEANTVLNATQDERKQAKESLDKLHKKISRIFGAAQRGDLSRAQRDLASSVKAANKYQGQDRVKLDERLEEVTEAVNKMGDWKDFATEPKLIDLCEKMERLPEQERASKNPTADKLAAKIKTLQEAWKALGNSDISDTYWPRFKEAGDKAYEPCAEFFKQHREIQKANLQKREPLVDKMKDLFESTDWDAKPDYKSIEESISQVMQGWKKIKDVDRGKGQKQWEKLASFKDQINEKLDVEYEKNIAAKESLITQLDVMLEQDVTEQSLEKLQFIQGKWKHIGLTRRKQDQAAWVKFKAVSDAVYEKIQGLRDAKRAVEDEKIGAFKQIHKQIHALAKSTQDLSVSDKEFEALEAQYKELPPLPDALPEKLIERLNNDYAKACDAYAGAKDRLNKAKLDNELDTLANKAQLCSELEQLSENAKQADIDELNAKIESLEITNKEYIKRFAERLKKARESDREDYGKARRLLLIECEILLDIESPKEDKDLRLQIQLDRMKEQGFGNVPINASAKMDDLKLDWLCMPGAEAKLQKKFDTRFAKLFN